MNCAIRTFRLQKCEMDCHEIHVQGNDDYDAFTRCHVRCADRCLNDCRDALSENRYLEGFNQTAFDQFFEGCFFRCDNEYSEHLKRYHEDGTPLKKKFRTERST